MDLYQLIATGVGLLGAVVVLQIVIVLRQGKRNARPGN